MATEVLAQPAVELEHTNGDVEVQAENAVEQPTTEAEVDTVPRLYFVRIPRPPLDDAARQRLQQEFQSHLNDLKGINARLAAKREVVKNLRNQMAQAKSLKGSAQPEFEDKLNRLKQLRDLRASYIADVSAIKNKVKGLDCKTEQELDAKIKAEEERIRFGSVTLREEKMIVNEISKLRSQRDRVKEYELEKNRMAELESSIAKVKAATEELESEFSIIKGERDAASKVMTDFYDQLKAAEKEASKVEEEQKEAAEKKNEALEALEAAKREVDASMQDYRENRKFSLLIRDKVANGEAESAQELCVTQVEELISKLLTDSVFRAEYNKLMADNRRTPVSDLLPESCSAAVAAAAPAAPAGKGGKGGKGAAGAEAAPVKLVPRGKEKAQELIASIMQSASAEAATRRLAAPQHYDEEAADEPETTAAAVAEAPKPVVPVKPAAPAKHVENPAAKAAEVFGFKVTVPKVEDVEFVAPVTKTEAEPVSKEQIREEQRLKAAEAEARKKKRQEQTEKKRVKAIELQKKAEEEEKLAKARAAQEARAPVRAPEPEQEPEEETVTVTERAPARDAAASSKPAASAAVAPKLVAPGGKRPAGKANLVRKLKKFYQANQVAIVVAAVVAFILFILLAASFY